MNSEAEQNKTEDNFTLVIKQKTLFFKKNRSGFFIKNGQAHFIKNADQGFRQGNNDTLINQFKLALKKYPRIFSFLYFILGSSAVGKSPKEAIKNVDPNKIILNLGSGIKRIRADVINVDFCPFDNVDIVADISDLPFADNSIDAVINEYVLEHLHNPEKVVGEMHRVMKPGAILYLTVPFVANFHSSPNDYYRWSKIGLKTLIKDFQEIDCGVRSGPDRKSVV
ncbi:MAG: class I SAM-dependent methyltransferase [Patescibacteria group bacterium]|nr:class I SAM-dependent methyltransferase [Patescibacteria group bacterium]